VIPSISTIYRHIKRFCCSTHRWKKNENHFQNTLFESPCMRESTDIYVSINKYINNNNILRVPEREKTPPQSSDRSSEKNSSALRPVPPPPTRVPLPATARRTAAASCIPFGFRRTESVGQSRAQTGYTRRRGSVQGFPFRRVQGIYKNNNTIYMLYACPS